MGGGFLAGSGLSNLLTEANANAASHVFSNEFNSGPVSVLYTASILAPRAIGKPPPAPCA